MFAEKNSFCSADYVSFPPLCLKAVTKLANANNAAGTCTDEGAILPVIRSSETQERLLRLLHANQRLQTFWLGLSHSNKSHGQAIWGTGEMFNPDEYDNFSDSRRINENKSCAVFVTLVTEWRSHYCVNLRHSVCMKWSANVMPVKLVSNDLPQIQATYFPENGVILNSAPVYKSANSNQNFYLYRASFEAGKFLLSIFQ